MARNMVLIIVILLMDKSYLIKSKLDVHWGALVQTVPKTKIKYMLVHIKPPYKIELVYKKIFQL